MADEALHAFLSSESELPFSTAVMEIALLHRQQQIQSRSLSLCSAGPSTPLSSFLFSPESKGLCKALSPSWTAGILHGFAVHQELYLENNEFLSCGHALLEISKK